jgi:hypothetical protein
MIMVALLRYDQDLLESGNWTPEYENTTQKMVIHRYKPKYICLMMLCPTVPSPGKTAGGAGVGRC